MATVSPTVVPRLRASSLSSSWVDRSIRTLVLAIPKAYKLACTCAYRSTGLLPCEAAAERATQRFLPRWSGSETGTDDDFPKDFSPVERQRNGGVRPKAGRGRERSEPGDTLEFPGRPSAPYLGDKAKPRTSPPA